MDQDTKDFVSYVESQGYKFETLPYEILPEGEYVCITSGDTVLIAFSKPPDATLEWVIELIHFIIKP
jgi:hypothetical protein